jgi:heme A synthase
MATQQAPRTYEAAESDVTGTRPDRLFISLIGLTSLAILLQGLWAGLFIREGVDFDATSSQSHWVEVHDTGARIAVVLALLSLVVAVWRLRSRRDLLVGTAVLFALLVLEAWLGGEIGEHPDWPAFHVPLAMVLVSLSVWLPLRAVRARRRTAASS